MKIKAIFAAITLFVITTLTAQSATAPKREFRSTWIAGIGIDIPSGNESTTKTRLTSYLDNLQAQNFTGVCFHVRSHADAYYKSSLEPASKYISGERGTYPGWDALEWMVEECHKRGMECYAWVNPFRVSASGLNTSTSFDREWYNNGWLLAGTNNTNYYVFNPGIEAARQHCLDVIKDIYTRYDIDGMLFDDYFYPGGGTAEDSSAGDYNLWRNSGTSLSIGDWRRENVNSFVKEVYDAIQNDRPDMRFGIGPAGVAGASGNKYGVGRPNISASDWMYAQIYCDPLAWLNEGSIDFLAPQLYWATTSTVAPFEPLAQWYDKVLTKFGRHLYISPGASGMDNYGGNSASGAWSELLTELNISRENNDNGACGMIWYSARWINGPTYTGFGNYLKQNGYTKPSLVPEITWKDAPTYAAPSGLSQSGTKLSWTATTGAKSNSIIRYTVYAVPKSVSLEAAADANGDGLSSDYLLGITYDPSYTLTSAQSSGYWYAVCVYDGYGKESDPALFNYVKREPADKPQLLAPANNATFGYGDINFSWKVNDATGINNYTLEVCKSGNDFATILYRTTVTGTSATIAANTLSEGTYDWHVKAAGTEVETTTSDAYTFTFAKTPADKPQLLTPANGSSFGDEDIVFSWKVNNAAGIDNYTLEVCNSGNNFATVLLQETITGTSTTISARRLGEGSFDWRVKAVGTTVSTATSSSATFSINDLPAGTIEEGYIPITDGCQYDAINDIAIENLWFRSTKSGYDNTNDDFDDGNGVGVGLQRGMAATTDGVYVSRRSANSASIYTDIYLDKYDPNNGEFLGSITLDNTAAAHGYYPNNDVIKDTAGNIIISNLSINLRSYAIYLYKVNTETGDLTLVATLGAPSSSTSYRVDHVGIYGDVDSDQFYVFAGVANQNYIFRWTITNAQTSATPTMFTVQSRYPTSAQNLGIAPRVRPVSATQVWVDGANTAMTLYTLSSNRATATATFASAPALAPVNPLDNGGALFNFQNKPYIVYNVEPASASDLGYYGKFNVAGMSSATSLDNLEKMWTIPGSDTGLGGNISNTSGAPVDCVEYPDKGYVNIFLYSPTNGLAGYRVYNKNSTGIDNITADDNAAVLGVIGRTVFVRDAANVAAYNLSGAIVATSTGNKLTLPAAGTYIIVAGTTHALVAVK